MADFQGIIVIHKEKGFTSHDVVSQASGNSPYEKNRTYRYA